MQEAVTTLKPTEPGVGRPQAGGARCLGLSGGQWSMGASELNISPVLGPGASRPVLSACFSGTAFKLSPLCHSLELH